MLETIHDLNQKQNELVEFNQLAEKKTNEKASKTTDKKSADTVAVADAQV